MDIPHYEEEYDEPLAANLQAEFGLRVAAAVINNNPELLERLPELVEPSAVNTRILFSKRFLTKIW